MKAGTCGEKMRESEGSSEGSGGVTVKVMRSGIWVSRSVAPTGVRCFISFDRGANVFLICRTTSSLLGLGNGSFFLDMGGYRMRSVGNWNKA